MGDFCEKSHFSPLKVENTFQVHFQKKSLAEPGPVGRGVTNMEKKFFAFLDELDHSKHFFKNWLKSMTFDLRPPSPPLGEG